MYLTRHSDMIVDIPLDKQINIIGAGSIGSYTALALAKLGFNNITVADDGIIEEENIAPQFYRPRDIGKFKVDCLKRYIKEQTGVEIITINAKIETDTIAFLSQGVPNVLILAVDSMQARKFIYTHHAYDFLIDSRMAIEFLTVISCASSVADHRAYKATLFDDSDAVQEACTNKAISYTSLIAGGLIAKRVLDMLKGDHAFTTINFDINSFDMVRLS